MTTVAEPDELTQATERLNRLRHECGCKQGAWAMTAALIAAPILAIIHGASGITGALLLAIIAAAAVIAAAMTGKVAAIAVYRLRWRIERRQVLRRLAERGIDQDVILR